MAFMTEKEAAQKWAVSPQHVAALCATNRIIGATRVGGCWTIPAHAEKPSDMVLPSRAGAVKPFLKWAGGKTQLLEVIRRHYPPGLGTRVTRYAEPFVGGGAVLFDILGRYRMEAVYISDINWELILTYSALRDHVDELIAVLRGLAEGYLPLSNEDRRDDYYAKRARFNALKAAADDSVELAALFIYLNKTCFNGLYRVNSRGYFNVPMGCYKQPAICDEALLRTVSERLQGVQIVCGEYDEAGDFIDDKTFAYFDPPYRPLSATASFTSYAPTGFDEQQQIELAHFIHAMSRKGAYVMASNSDPKNTDESDDFFDKLYHPLSIIRVPAGRAINSVGSGRGMISELLISNERRDANEAVS